MEQGSDKTLVNVVYGLIAALLICVCLLVYPSYSGKSAEMELQVAKQDYQRELAALDRKYESRVNNLQEQITARQFISNKRYDLITDDAKRMQRDIDDLRERLKSRNR